MGYQADTIQELITLLGSSSFTRSSTGTYFDSSAVMRTAAIDVPRIGHDPNTGAPRGILMEPAATNLFLRSAEIDNASWTKLNASVTANDRAAPDGTVSADKLVENTATGSHWFYQDVAITAGSLVCFSHFVRAAERNLHFIEIRNPVATNRIFVRFNSTAATFAGQGASGTATLLSYGSEALSDGWYRIWLVGSLGAGDATARCLALLANAAGLTSYTGDGASGLHVWGAQCEAGAESPSSYIATTTATATRAKDVLFLSAALWKNESKGTLVVIFMTRETNAFQFPFALQLSSDLTSERHAIRVDASNIIQGITVDGGVTQANISAGTKPTMSRILVAYSYETNKFRAACNGVLLTEDTAGTLPNYDRAYVGSLGSNQQLSGWLETAGFYPRALTDAELLALSK